MKLSVAPESSNASLSARLPSVYSETGIFIDLFQAMYTESVMQARARAIALRQILLVSLLCCYQFFDKGFPFFRG